MRTDIAELVKRLREHASMHEDIARYDDEQRQWMEDLVWAADEIEAMATLLLETRELLSQALRIAEQGLGQK